MARERLKQARIEKHWSQAVAAEHIGIDAATLCRWENGKSTPSLYNIQQLCDAYGVTAYELGLERGGSSEDMEIPPSPHDDFKEIPILQDLTMRLMTLAFVGHRSFQDLQDAMAAIIEDFDAMNNNEALTLTRRDALSRLAALPLITLGLTGMPSVAAQRNIGDTLNQCAVGIAASRELAKSLDSDDLSLAYKAVSAYLPTLTKIMKDSSQHRKMAANLATQCARLQTALGRIGWQSENLYQANLHANDAVNYATEADDSALLISSLISQAWVCYYDRRGSQGVTAIGNALPLLKHSDVPSSLAVRVLSTQTVLQAKTGSIQDSTDSLRQTHRMMNRLNGSDYYAFTETVFAETVGNEGMAYYHTGQYDKALDTFCQLIDPNTLVSKMPVSGKGRVEMLNFMALSSLKAPKKDMDQTVKFWRAGIEGAKSLQSKQRFNESLAIYDAMEAVWPGETQIVTLRALTNW